MKVDRRILGNHGQATVYPPAHHFERKDRPMPNIACRIFQEQLDLIKELPEQERATVLYTAVCNAFNQFENQNENQIDIQNENAYVSVSVSVLGNTVIKLLSKSIVCKEFSNNYGGKRLNSGRPRKKNQNENQFDNQNDIQIENQIEKTKASANVNTRFNAGFQNWKFEPTLLAIAKKYWTADTIRKIEIDFSCQEYNTETSIQELLERYPADVSKGFKKPTIDEIKAYCQERSNSVDPDKFYNYYESNGWKVGKNPMKNWKSAVITWEKSGYNTQKKPNINLDACEDNFLDDTPYWLKNKKD